jgi:hypothetical protein
MAGRKGVMAGRKEGRIWQEGKECKMAGRTGVRDGRMERNEGYGRKGKEEVSLGISFLLAVNKKWQKKMHHFLFTARCTEVAMVVLCKGGNGRRTFHLGHKLASV